MASKIEWTDATWNPVRGCSRVSRGCENCYAERMAARFSGGSAGHIAGPTGPFSLPGDNQSFHGFAQMTKAGPRWTGKVKLVEERLEIPLHWRKPRLVFVNSMSDLFHEALAFEDILRVYRIMQRAHWHTYQILTKRHERLYEFTQWLAGRDDISIAEWPRQCRLGVSVEDQATADERIPWLLKTPAAVRFVSAEPLLGPVDFAPYLCICKTCMGAGHDVSKRCGSGIHQVICGGESGPGARPMHPSWVRSIRDQCQAAGVKFFFKQYGEYVSVRWGDSAWGAGEIPLHPDGTDCRGYEALIDDTTAIMRRVGKKAAGATLDGREWREQPS